jgi:uncharacterized protein YkwD
VAESINHLEPVPVPLNRRRLLLIPAIALLLAGAVVVPVSPEPVAARGGLRFVEAVNEHRSDAGLRPLRLHAVVEQIAIERANQMASAKQMNHDLEFIGRRLRKAGVCVERIGEIVAYNTLSDSNRVGRFVNQWYRSDPHRAIMLNSSYTHAAGSYTGASNGKLYAAMIFIRVCR